MLEEKRHSVAAAEFAVLLAVEEERTRLGLVVITLAIL
jgi:hypothetical protein